MANSTNKISFEFTTNSIIKVIIIGLLVGIIYLIREVVAILFFALILVSILEPMVNWLRQKKIPKFFAVLLLYLVLIITLILILILLIPPILEQIDQFTLNFPQYYNKIIDKFYRLSSFLSSYGVALSLKSYLVSLNNFLPETTTGLLEKIGDFFSNIVSIFVILVITFYMLVEENATKKILRSVIPNQYLPYAYDMFNRIEKQLGLWLRGQIILCFLVFLLVYIGLTVLGIKYALILAIIAGLFEFIPYLGPIFAGGVAVLITFLHSPLQAFWVLILYICIQILENNVLVPNIMRRAVGLNPVISIISLLIGSKLGGFIGAIIAIPLATALYVLFQDFYAKKQAEEMKLE
ncbi:MAG: hypothetical protein A2Y82_00525 [Candidatus Buchananbacteria bacterium RBG_13_36_9]|uniref:AI-2E family transporter n=1 Tax=Candidatus Buchananbacteria bacterium RBG_13_36_9 TaxID=1797530 RepID=A0A1G1XQK3_9BACT|nr:MAG: hypothetical protein A2Y82_00525 [Candidatus Buchananbacteria bacterium RBG_13_36_9]